MAWATCGRSIPLPAIASGFGLNEGCGHFELAVRYLVSPEIHLFFPEHTATFKP